MTINSISHYFLARISSNLLENCYLIQSDDTASTLSELEKIIKNTIFCSNIDFCNHPDFKLIRRNKDDNAKDITVAQIRELQEFLYRTLAIAKYKIAIIYEADLMNLNAANACLKILEDTPRHSCIFLISSRSDSVIATIRSRCIKLYDRREKLNNLSDLQIKFIEALLVANINNKIDFLKDFFLSNQDSKKRDWWLEISDYALILINKLAKKSIGIDITLNILEEKLAQQFQSLTPLYLLKKFNEVKRIIDDTIKFDLDTKASCILLMEKCSK